MIQMTQGQDSGSYRLLNTSGTRMGLKENSGHGKQEGRDMGHCVRIGQELLGGRYTRKALFECLADEFGLFLNFNSILQHHHRDDGYALGFEESEKIHISTSPRRQGPSLLAPSPEARPGTYDQFKTHDQLS